jgi:membrane protein YqaA with SNARE-associated domain
MKRLYLWVLHWAETPYGTPALFGLALAESSFFPIPPDVLQIALSISRPRRSFYYALVSGVGSVLGAILGWLIGFVLWAAVGGFFTRYVPGCSPENIQLVRDMYRENAFFAILCAAFTPIPFKVFTITAGMAEISLAVLLAASLLGRFGRFFLVATTIFLFGPSVKALLDKYLELVTITLFVLLVGGFFAIKFLF